MNKIAVFAVFTAIIYSGCSDHCRGGETWCKNDNVQLYCNEEVDGDWREVNCNLGAPVEGAACFDRNSDGNAFCLRRCELGAVPRCEIDNSLSICVEKKYSDGSVGGVLWNEPCYYGCSVTNGVAKCNEKPSE